MDREEVFKKANYELLFAKEISNEKRLYRDGKSQDKQNTSPIHDDL